MEELSLLSLPYEILLNIFEYIKIFLHKQYYLSAFNSSHTKYYVSKNNFDNEITSKIMSLRLVSKLFDNLCRDSITSLNINEKITEKNNDTWLSKMKSIKTLKIYWNSNNGWTSKKKHMKISKIYKYNTLFPISQKGIISLNCLQDLTLHNTSDIIDTLKLLEYLSKSLKRLTLSGEVIIKISCIKQCKNLEYLDIKNLSHESLLTMRRTCMSTYKYTLSKSLKIVHYTDLYNFFTTMFLQQSFNKHINIETLGLKYNPNDSYTKYLLDKNFISDKYLYLQTLHLTGDIIITIENIVFLKQLKHLYLYNNSNIFNKNINDHVIYLETLHLHECHYSFKHLIKSVDTQTLLNLYIHEKNTFENIANIVWGEYYNIYSLNKFFKLRTLYILFNDIYELNIKNFPNLEELFIGSKIQLIPLIMNLKNGKHSYVENTVLKKLIMNHTNISMLALKTFTELRDLFLRCSKVFGNDDILMTEKNIKQQLPLVQMTIS